MRPLASLLALLPIACAHPPADTRPPEPARIEAPVEVEEDVEPPVGTAQTISFADDADPEPSTQIQGAPKRPPIPRFQLFGTREGDGPH